MTTPSALLAARAATGPDSPLLHMNGATFTYGELDRASSEVAGHLIDLAGVAAGDRVATMLSNRPEAVMCWFGIERSGAVEVPINTALRGRLLAEQLELSRPRLVLVDAELASAIAEVGGDLPESPEVMIVDEGAASVRGRAHPGIAEDDTATAVILFTSGTTGRSKGVVLPHRATMRLANGIATHVGLSSDDVLLTPFPLFHIAARFVSVVAAMCCDGQVVVERRFSASRFWDICRDHGVTAIHYLGTLPMMLFNQPASRDDHRHPVRVAYGAGMPPPVWREFEDRFGVRVHELYGSTEQGMVAINRGEDIRVGTCGRPTEDVDLEIHDPRGRPVPAGTAGEIVVRPRRPYAFFSGYDRMPEATLDAWRGLWFRTGDLGRLDGDGYLTFGGRLKEAIRRRGENISAWEVERAVAAYRGVVDVAVVGVPSELGEEEVLAVVVADDAVDWPALAAHCADALPSHAVPRFFRRIESLPMTPTGRVRRVELSQMVDGTWDRETFVLERSG